MEVSNINPKENFIRKEKEAFKEITNDFFSPEKRQKTISDFFGVVENSLSHEEEENFVAYGKYALKRILNADLHKNGFHPEEVKDFFEQIKNESNFLYIHDIGHSIAMYQDQPSDNSIVPEFYKTSNEEGINNRKLIAEEPRALVWMAYQSPKPLSLMILDEESKKEFVQNISNSYGENYGESVKNIVDAVETTKITNAEEYVEAYQKLIYAIIEMPNLQAIMSKSGEVPESQINEMKDSYFKIISDLKESPDPKLLELLTNVYNNRDNPKVLYDEFYRICEPLVKKLAARKS